MNKSDWDKVKVELSSPFGAVNLKADGYDVALRISRKNPLRYVIIVYVNGVFKGSWLLADKGEEEGRRFFPEHSRPLYRGKGRARIESAHKALPKKHRSKLLGDMLDARFNYRLGYWCSVDALRRHFEKHNQSIELVSIGYAATA